MLRQAAASSGSLPENVALAVSALSLIVGVEFHFNQPYFERLWGVDVPRVGDIMVYGYLNGILHS